MSTGSLAVLTGVGAFSARRLRLVLMHHSPDEALQLLRCGRALHPMCVQGLPKATIARVQAVVTRADEAAAAERCDELGVVAVSALDDAYPAALAGDPEAPGVLFVRGDLAALRRRRVGIVGTRHPSAAGRATAIELGQELAAAGLSVVSGLARGVDAAAHIGVRRSDGPGLPIAVVGSGLDMHYPRQNTDLWEWVAGKGALLSEWPPGVPPEAWRFPERNRIIAALSEVLVVVESRERGGSLITAREALDRGVQVMAVPGSPRSRASTGTNALIRDGAAPVTSVVDVAVALSLDHERSSEFESDRRRPPDAVQQAVLDACRDAPSNLDAIVTATGLSITDAALAAARLERAGWVVEAGGWFEAVGSRLGRP